MGNCPGGSRGIYNRCPGTARSTTHKISNFARAVRAARANAPNQAPYSVSHSLLSKNYMPELHFLRGCPDCSGSHRHRAKGSTRTTLLWHSVFLPFARAPQRQIACKTRFRPGSPGRFRPFARTARASLRTKISAGPGALCMPWQCARATR